MTMYITVDEAGGYVRNGVTADLVEIESALTSASAMIDRYCARTFVVPTVATTRLFVANDTYLVKVDDIANTTDLVIIDDTSTVAAADYQLETSPGRTARPDPAGLTRPFAYVRRLSGGWNIDDEATLSVTAMFGWPAIPDEVKLAAKMLAKDLFNTRDTRFGFAQVGDFSRRIGENSMVTGLLNPLKSADSIGIA